MKKASSLYKMDPHLDKDSTLQVGGRLKHADISEAAKHPSLFPRRGLWPVLILPIIIAWLSTRDAAWHTVRFSLPDSGSLVVPLHHIQCYCKVFPWSKTQRATTRTEDGRSPKGSGTACTTFFLLCSWLLWPRVCQRGLSSRQEVWGPLCMLSM